MLSSRLSISGKASPSASSSSPSASGGGKSDDGGSSNPVVAQIMGMLPETIKEILALLRGMVDAGKEFADGMEFKPGNLSIALATHGAKLWTKSREEQLAECLEDIAKLRAETEAGRNPRDAKVQLAQEIITRFHTKQAAHDALANFEARFRDGAVPENMPELTLSGAPLGVLKVLREAGLVASGTEAQRNVEQGGVKIDSVKVEDKGLQLPAGTYVIQVGKRKFARVTLA